MSSDFFEIDIIKYLKESNSPFYTKISELYELSQRVLGLIPKLFSNYTIHDIGHSIRVIEYMNELAKQNLTEYSELHLALIVYVGLLHDIGMVVSNNEEKELYKEFENNNPNFIKYSNEEKKEYIKNYVRENHGKRVNSCLDLDINECTKIRSLLYVGETSSFDISSLVGDICRSHTESYNWLINNLEDDYRIANYKINPQHIAILLRIGDALDIDDRRAPWVLYKYLNPQGVSNIEWRKHIPIRNYEKIEFKENKYEIIFAGECSEYEIYIKILEYTDWINAEIENLNSILRGFDEIYRFQFKLPINVNIKTIGFKEEPIRFNLQYEQIAKLLMGEKIYGSKKDGLRELIQNAIDAVLLINDIEKRKTFTSYNPTVGIEFDKSNNQFIVFDNGAGMSEEILKKYFFNIGNSYYISNDFKKKMCKYNPIGHFGIGFLACFMLSPKIELETRHYKSHKPIKLSFEKDSPYITWFISNNNTLSEHGTRIIMNYDKIIPNIFKTEEEVVNYIQDLIITDDYKFLIINNDNKTEVSIDNPKNKYKIENGYIRFDYKLIDLPNVKFDIFSFFENNEYVYFVDHEFDTYYANNVFYDESIITLAYFKELINEFDLELQQNDGNIDEDNIFEYPYLFQNIINDNYAKINEYYNNNNSIHGYFSEYLNHCIKNSIFKWFDIPIILNINIFNSFLDCIDRNGYERALYEYKGDIKYLSIIGTDDLNDDLVFAIVMHFIDISDLDLDIDYYSSYPIKPIERSVTLLKAFESNNFVKVENNYLLNDCSKYKVYLKGIRIKDESITLPYIISGTQIEYIYLNIDSNDFDTDVSRNNFDKDAKMKLEKYIIKFIYEDLIARNQTTEDESNMLKLFLNTYYN